MSLIKIFKIPLLLFLVVFYNNISAIEIKTSFIVFFIKGDITINNETANKGLKINKKDKLIIKSGEITFLTPNKNILKIDRAGTYTFSKLIELQNGLETNISAEYFAFIWENVTKKDEVENNVHGGVYRGNTLMVFPLNYTKIIDNEINFYWNTEIQNNDYYFIILNKDKDRIITIKSKDTSISILPYYTSLIKGEKYYWCVTNNNSLNKTTAYYNFEIPTYEWEKKFKKELSEFKKQLSYNDELNTLMLIYFYESNSLMMDAYKQYKKALEKYPTSTDIKKAFDLFKENNFIY